MRSFSTGRAGSIFAITGMFRYLALTAFMGLAATPVFVAQPAEAQAEAQAETFSFSSIKIDGNRRIETATILAYTDVTLNQQITAAQLNDVYQSVVASGQFESVEFVPQGSQLIIKVVEYPTINRVNVEGNKRLDDEKALELIQSQPRHVFNPVQVERDALELTKAYQAQGRFSTSVTPRIIRLSDNRVDLVFEVNETRNVEVERISFVGNRSYSDRRLRRVLGSKQAGLLRMLIRQDSFVEERIDFDKLLLSDFYQARGYVDFQVLSASSEFSRERNGFFLTFNVREGQQFKFGAITTVSEMNGVNAEDFMKVGRIRSGRVYTPVDIDKTISRMELLALRKGLNFLRVEPRVTRNDRTLTLDIEFALVHGPRVFVERIDIEGNATTLDRVIRRQFRIVEGDPFNPREIREAADRIEALGLFEDSEVDARTGTTQDQVVVDVNVEEQLTGSLGFGAAYSPTDGIGFTANFTERNFMGRGQTLNVDLAFGLDNSSRGFTFIEPAFLSRDVTFRFDTEYRQTEYSYTDYNTQGILFRPSFEFPVSEYGRFGLRYTYSDDKIYKVSRNSSAILLAEEQRGNVQSHALGYSFSYDTRFTGLDSSSGVLLRFGQDYAAYGSNGSYIKTNALAVAETTAFNEEIVLRAVLEGGGLVTSGPPSRITERFFLTTSNLRGFKPAGVGPRDLTVANKDALGGNYYAVARLESEFPLGLPDEYGLSGAAYLDVGSIWGLDNTDNGAVDDKLHLRAAIGFSIIWDSGFGPLRVNFTKVLQKEKYDRTQVFEFTVSTQF